MPSRPTNGIQPFSPLVTFLNIRHPTHSTPSLCLPHSPAFSVLPFHSYPPLVTSLIIRHPTLPHPRFVFLIPRRFLCYFFTPTLVRLFSLFATPPSLLFPYAILSFPPKLTISRSLLVHVYLYFDYEGQLN
jgi:hypothetical protein